VKARVTSLQVAAIARQAGACASGHPRSSDADAALTLRQDKLWRPVREGADPIGAAVARSGARLCALSGRCSPTV